MDKADKILESRSELLRQVPALAPNPEEEGGYGVTGFINSIPVTGKNIFEHLKNCGVCGECGALLQAG